MTTKDKLLALYDTFPFHNHPFWKAVLECKLNHQQIMKAEVQHYLRTRAGQRLRYQAMTESQAISPTIFAAVVQTYVEECAPGNDEPSHLDLIERLVLAGGVTKTELASAKPTPGNSAAMALYRDIGTRGAACHILGAGAVEFFYSKLAPQVFATYIGHYGMAPLAAETYRLHGPMDELHASMAFEIADEAVSIHGWDTVEMSVRDAFVATSLHYDGMLQAALGNTLYWGGQLR